MTPDQTTAVRDALAELPDGTSHGEQPQPGNVYLPQSHLKALHPDVAVVTGMRGAGKTFWWSALQDPAVRTLIRRRRARSGLSANTELRTGFGVRAAPSEYPSKDVLSQLLKDGNDARMVWRSVQAWQVAEDVDPVRRQPDWPSRVAYVRHHPEEIEQLFAARDAKLEGEGAHLLIVYDALDRSADDWKTMYRLIRGLLQTALDMRSYRRIRVKLFLRTDQCSASEIGNFPDASKLLSSAIDLSWPRRELYGLLWHLLGNVSGSAEKMRSLLYAEKWPTNGPQQVPDRLVFDETLQRETLHKIAGPRMGPDGRRGYPYTWIPNHLGDTEGNVSPRSFIAALQGAAESTCERYPNHNHALHYESVKQGVQKASRIRVFELSEDYPWIDLLLRDLDRMVVPCNFADVASRWGNRKSLARLREKVQQEDVKLPPRGIDEGAEGVRRDLEALSIFQRMHDGRVNIPDVFRVGYGLGRHGGVSPVR